MNALLEYFNKNFECSITEYRSILTEFVYISPNNFMPTYYYAGIFDINLLPDLQKFQICVIDTNSVNFFPYLAFLVIVST